MFFPSTPPFMPYYYTGPVNYVIMTGGTPPTSHRSGVAPAESHNYPVAVIQPQHPFTIFSSTNVSDGEAGIPAVTASGGNGEQSSGFSNVAPFTFPPSHQRTFPDGDVLDNPEQFDDAPYIPPRASQAVPLDPRVATVYNDIQHSYPYEGGTSPAESHHSVDWSTSSSSSASSQQILNEYALEPTSQYSRPPHVTTYPQQHHVYHGHHRSQADYEHAEQPANTGGSYYRSQGYMDGLVAQDHDNLNAHTTIPSQSSSFSANNHPPNISTFSVSSRSDGTRALFPDAGPYLRKQLGLAVDADVSLRTVPEPVRGEKPSTPLPMLVKLAIYGSPHKQLTLQEIYSELENRFQWFRDHKHERAWKNSIRHNLSLNKVFKHVPRPITEPGKGSYWQLDVSEGEGYKRTRKRRPKHRIMASEEEEEATSDVDEDRQSPLDLSQNPGPCRSSVPSVEDTQIDPELRSEGHVVGDGRTQTRSTTRRAGAGSPYPQQSPRYQQGSLPGVAGQDTSVPGQPVVRFGQSSLNFPTHPHPRPMPVASSTLSFADGSMMTMVPAVPGQQPQPSYDQILQPVPRSGIEYGMNPVRTYPELPKQFEENAEERSSPESSSGSSRTWNNARSRSE